MLRELLGHIASVLGFSNHSWVCQLSSVLLFVGVSNAISYQTSAGHIIKSYLADQVLGKIF